VDLGLSRNVSVTQLIANLGSITGGDDAQLDASKDWRLSWWTKIYGYTIDGPYLWVGKGFGVNLATDDGFQVDEEQSLRAPHSAHLEILARAGLPGLALWALLQLAFAAAMLRAAAIARRIKEPVWIPLLGWVFVYWLAALVNGSFDVYLGGPQGGIWFWSMIGLGLALTRMVNERAAAVRDETTPRIAERLPRGSARPSADALRPVTPV
jgi:O-antigen ligase